MRPLSLLVVLALVLPLVPAVPASAASAPAAAAVSTPAPPGPPAAASGAARAVRHRAGAGPAHIRIGCAVLPRTAPRPIVVIIPSVTVVVISVCWNPQDMFRLARR